jgi:hypothetical protein
MGVIYEGYKRYEGYKEITIIAEQINEVRDAARAASAHAKHRNLGLIGLQR